MSNSNNWNGWTNYATWRIALDFFDGDTSNYVENGDVYELSKELQELVEQTIEEQASGTALDYALSFVSDCNFYEIAEHILEENKQKA